MSTNLLGEYDCDGYLLDERHSTAIQTSKHFHYDHEKNKPKELAIWQRSDIDEKKYEAQKIEVLYSNFYLNRLRRS